MANAEERVDAISRSSEARNETPALYPTLSSALTGNGNLDFHDINIDTSAVFQSDEHDDDRVSPTMAISENEAPNIASDSWDVIIETSEIGGGVTATNDDDEDAPGKYCISPAYCSELKTLVLRSLPIVILSWLDQIMSAVTAIFSGQLGKNELAGSSLAMSTTKFICQSAGKGITAVALTGIAQSRTSSNPHQAGVYLQTNQLSPVICKPSFGRLRKQFLNAALMILTLSTMIVWSVMFNIYYIFIALRQDPTVASIAADFALVYPVGNAVRSLYLLFSRYLFTQNKYLPSILIFSFANILSAALQYLFVFIFNMGTSGCALGYTVAFIVNALLHFLYICISGIYIGTWNGWSRQSLLDWGRFTRVAIFAIVMLGIEDTMFTIGTIVSGVLGVTELAASSILIQLWPIFASTAAGLRDIAAVRIGCFLGELASAAAKRVSRIAFVIAEILAIVAAVILLAMYNILPRIFTTSEDVLQIAEGLMYILALLSYIIPLKRATDGILVGCGKQVHGGVLSLLGYIVIAMPIISILLFLTDLGVYAYWWGMVIGYAAATLLQYTVIYRTDWNLETKKALVRAKIKDKVEKSTETTPLISTSSQQSNQGADLTPSQWRRLYIKRGVTISLVVLWFIMSVFVRVFVLVPVVPPASGNSSMATGLLENLTLFR